MNIHHFFSYWKKQTDIAKKQYQVSDKIHRYNTEDDETINTKATLKMLKESGVFYSNKFRFNNDINRFKTLSFDVKYNLVRFHQDLNRKMGFRGKQGFKVGPKKQPLATPCFLKNLSFLKIFKALFCLF